MGKRTESLQGSDWGGNPQARPPGGKANLAGISPSHGDWEGSGANGQRGTIKDVAPSETGIKVWA